MSAGATDKRQGRIQRIVLLLQHRLDYLDSAQRLAQSFPSKPGAQPTHKVACSCARLYRNSWVGVPNCPMCAGTGFRRRLRALDGDSRQDERGAIFDPYTYAYDRSDKASSTAGLRVMERWEVDRELAQLRSNARARAGVNTDSYGWEKARERRDRSGSFRELDQALDALSIQRPGLAELVTNVFRGVYGPVDKFSDGLPHRLPVAAGPAFRAALLFIEARMPDPIRVPQYLTDTAKSDERKESVAATYQRTNSISKTAFSHGMRKARCKEILRAAGLIG